MAGSPPIERAYLLVYSQGSSSIASLPADGQATIGAEAGCDLLLGGEGIAPRHLTLTLASGRATASPLQGETLLNGECLTAVRALASGDLLTLGDVTLLFRSFAGGPAERHLYDREQLRARLEEEIERSLRYQRQLTLLAIELGRDDLEDRPIVQALDSALRTVDVAARSGPSQLLILLPETAESAHVPAERILKAFAPHARQARAGMATCPSDACDADSLLVGACNAAWVAQPGTVRSLADTTTTLKVGDRTIIAADPAVTKLFALVERLAASDIPVLVTGETGVGKEIVATALHAWSVRRDQPLVSINCAAVPESLLESELFGHEKGAFSDAIAAKPGLLETAAGGMLFLDEIGELSLTAQAKLLRVLETRRVSRVGSITSRAIDVRIVAATNRSLEADIVSSQFRQDLYFRISAATVVLPPLRERPHDLAPLARSFLADACVRLGRSPLGLAPGTMARLAAYRWPGNIRELKNLMEYFAATVSEAVVEPVMLPPALQGRAPSTAESSPRSRVAVLTPSPGFRNIYDEIRELEQKRMAAALAAAGGVRVRAAELIGMPLRTFVTKMKEYQLDGVRARKGTTKG